MPDKKEEVKNGKVEIPGVTKSTEASKNLEKEITFQ